MRADNGSPGIGAVNDPLPGQVLAVNADMELEWIEPGGGVEGPRILAAYINGLNGEVLASFNNGPGELVCERLEEGIYRIVYTIAFPEPVPGAIAPPFLSVLPEHPGENQAENIVPTYKGDEGLTHNGGCHLELRTLSEDKLIDANFHFIAMGGVK